LSCWGQEFCLPVLPGSAGIIQEIIMIEEIKSKLLEVGVRLDNLRGYL